MGKPIIMTVDDDAEVLQAIAHDIRHEYGERFRVIRAGSGEQALDVLRHVKLANEAVALLLADQRMPGLCGVEFLDQARRLVPAAKRAPCSCSSARSHPPPGCRDRCSSTSAASC